MTLHTWLLFLGAVFLLSGTPGPNMLHIMSRSVEIGVRRTMMAMFGCVSALVLMLIASAVGLAALLMALPGVFDVLRYAGVAYLIFLGVKAWRAEVAPNPAAQGRIVASLSALQVFRVGFAVGISNPKLLLFAAAFLPQFVDPTQPQAAQFAILVTTCAAADGFWYFVYAFGGRSLSICLTRPAIKRWFNRVTGGLFIGFGLALLRARPAT
jgi:threonine/homoserine/homoserine lactone efflux protein